MTNTPSRKPTLWIQWLPFFIYLYPAIAAVFVSSQYPEFFGKYSKGAVFLNLFNIFLYVSFYQFCRMRFILGKLFVLLALIVATILATANAMMHQLPIINTIWILVRLFSGFSMLILSFESFQNHRQAFSIIALCLGGLFLTTSFADGALYTYIKIAKLQINKHYLPENNLEISADVEDLHTEENSQAPGEENISSSESPGFSPMAQTPIRAPVKNLLTTTQKLMTPKKKFVKSPQDSQHRNIPIPQSSFEMFRTVADDLTKLDSQYLKFYPFRQNDIIFVGDSFVWGQGVSTTETSAAQLESILKTTSTPRKVHILAWPGTDLPSYVALISLLKKSDKVNRIILGFYLNDMPDQPYANRFQKFLQYSLADSTPVIRFIRDFLLRFRSSTIDEFHQQIINRYKKNDPTYLERWKIVHDYLYEFFLKAREHSTEKPILLIFPITVNYEKYPLEEAHKDLAKLGNELGYEVLDLLPMFKEKLLDGVKYRIIPQDNHFNSYVHRLVAEEIGNFLKTK